MGDSSHSSTEVLDPLLVRAVRETGAYGGAVLLLPPGGDRVLRLATVTGVPPAFARSWRRVGIDIPTPLAESVRERRLMWMGVGEMARRYPQAAVAAPYPFAVADVPLLTGDICWGALVLLWPGARPAELSPEELATVEAAGERLARVLSETDRAGRPVTAGDEPRFVARPRERTPGAAEALAAADFAERLPEGCCALDLDGRITFANRAAAELLDVGVPELLGGYVREALPWLSATAYEDRYRAAVLSQAPTFLTARRPPDRWLRFDLWPDPAGISMVITEIGRQTRAETTERAGATERAETVRTPPLAPTSPAGDGGEPVLTGALSHLMQLSATLTEATGVEEVVELVAGQLMPAFGAQGLVMFMAEGPRLRIVGHRGYTDEAIEAFEGAPLGAPPTPASNALTSGKPSFFASPEELGREYPGVPALVQKAAWAYLPLVTSGKPVGCCVLSYERPHHFPAEERAILTSLAGLIAQALERAHLHDATQQLARRLQDGLLPRELPEIPGLDVAARYLPATRGMEIGGDFYDLIRLDGTTTVAATIGDVQGHNVTAAALMGQVRTAVRAAAGAAPGEVLARTNKLLVDLDPGLFTSCLYVDIDLAHHRARLANAGHPPPLLRRPDGEVTVLRMPPGPLLGIVRRAEYPAIEVPFPPGAVLVLYTDGLVETPGIDLDVATDELAGHLARYGSVADRSTDEVADALLGHARQTASRSDDIALLLISPR
ncbi:SpoIIE family protein phosphatase [Streptomyces sp. NBC_01803]|uniref:SpoIIE family protein phosphatase n=1 Tax=Streptomyces sp. NBC_01803 TaxID=2975946 RepID=UPI002DDBDEF8|nr:SpoIIE family protein phosphatase [Streptomyces sp. NBC_01803]WSA45460.1 SpoIIE family protein phosphatase [Streptomyces sp. NBC_01803]